jgi:transcriptional regulator with XRE-family HTH domain
MGKPNDRLRMMRESQLWTQVQVAEMIGSTSVNVSRWENSMTFPSRYYRDKLCKLFGKSERDLGLDPRADENDFEEFPLPAFLFNEPLPIPEEMFGRKRESETLFSRTARKASTSITGPRRIGKTWLLRYFCLQVPERLGSRFRIGYLDGMSPQCRTVAGFAAEALRQLGLPAPEENEGLMSLDRGLQELVAKKLIPVLCIDEFECFGRDPDFSLEFFEGLRAMCNVSQLVLITTSRSPLHLVVRRDAQGSPFFNIFERILLKPFTYSETEQFIYEKSIAARFQNPEREYLWKYGREHEGDKGWLPLRLQLAGKLLIEEPEKIRRSDEYKEIFEEYFLTRYNAVMY